MKALILFAHGSVVEPANDAVRDLARSLAARSEYDSVEAAFLELAEPSLPGAIGSFAGSGYTQVVVVPYFLVPGKHLTRDLPGIVAELQRIYQGVSIQVTESLAGHPLVADAVLDRARTTYGGSGSEGQAD